MSGEAFYMLPVSMLSGFLVFSYLAGSRGNWLWLTSWGMRLGFFLWPRPPLKIVKLTMLDGGQLLLYDPVVRERRDGLQIETPLGIVSTPGKGSTVLPLTAIYVPGIPNPMTLIVYALAGLISAWLTYYYGYLLLGLEVDATFATLALVLMLYIYMYYNAASTSGVEYHSYEIRGLAPPFLHAVPSSEVVGPLKTAKWSNTPILIRVTDKAREGLETLKRALGVEDAGQVAELMATGELFHVVIQKATALKAGATRVSEALGAFNTLEFRIGRLTLGRTALMLLVFLVGIIVGWALGGGTVVVSPVPHNATLTGGLP